MLLIVKENRMNIQIFGTNKCFDTKKAMRYFKERNVKYQFIGQMHEMENLKLKVEN